MHAYANAVSRYLFVQGWQIAFLAIVVGGISYALRHKSAHIRYLLWLIVLAKCLMPPIYSVPVAVLPEDSSEDWLAQFMPLDFSAMSAADTAPSSAPVPVAKGQAVEPVVPTLVSKTRPTLSRTEVAVLVWSAGVCVFLLWVGGRTARYTSWLRSRRKLLSPDREQALRELLQGLKFKTLPRIYLTEEIGQPFVWGLFKGSVYLPESFSDLEDPQQCRTILSHELCHVARFDAAVNMLQVMIQAAYWFHPVVWWVNRKIRMEREKCCDEMAVAQLELSPEHYTSAIVEALAQERRSIHRVPSLAIVGSLRDIEERIRTMMRPGKRFRKHPSIIAAVTVLSLALLTVPTALVLTSRAGTEASGQVDQASDGVANEEVQEAMSPSPQEAPEEGAAAPRFVKMWPELPESSRYFQGPSSAAVDSAGNVYVAEFGINRIQKFTSNGTFITKWGGRGSGEGQFITPRGIALDASGNIYVADTYNHRIQKFTPEGDFVAKWGNKGSGDGQFNAPCGVAVDRSGNVYVADTDNHCIQKLTSSGTFIAKWGSKGTGDGQFNEPCAVAMDESGNIYVADCQNRRIQKFTSDGVFIAKWGSEGNGDGEFNRPLDIGLDATGKVYVLDRENYRIQTFTSDGDFIAKWGSSGSEDGKFGLPSGVALDRSGNVYVPDLKKFCIQVFTSEGDFIKKWGGSCGSGDGEFYLPFGVATDSTGNVYVADSQNNRIQKFSSEGVFITKWGSEGNDDGQFRHPGSLAVDNSDNVYVAGTNRIQKFTSSGTFITKWGRQGSGDGEFRGTYSVAVDNSGNVYVLDRGNHRIQKFTSDGDFITKWGCCEGSGMRRSTAMTVDDTGNVYVAVYVAEPPTYCIQKFTSDGTFITKWGSPGDGEGQFGWPSGLAADNSGNVYVVEFGNRRMQKFTSDGHLIVKWGSEGTGEGQFSGPMGLAVDNSGNVYVADTLNNRIQKFSPSR